MTEIGARTPLQQVGMICAQLESAVAAAMELTRARDDAIRKALSFGYPTADVARAAGLSPMRIYQIRDGK
ncbi:hypothetical protein [Rhodococcus pyridinivorans]|uniref:Homeodomain-like domain-containing protein n=1 Tax=Rhodococcus pyridinivorans TaxID=103816 RepID=A0A7M2XQ74_9NOCA|nr:hypothetical protein [Rhodococcus pyridinivorans]QOV99492.1 hypothetical protein INP59_03560 [Rhodococcus pyridinivorans]